MALRNRRRTRRPRRRTIRRRIGRRSYRRTARRARRTSEYPGRGRRVASYALNGRGRGAYYRTITSRTNFSFASCNGTVIGPYPAVFDPTGNAGSVFGDPMPAVHDWGALSTLYREYRTRSATLTFNMDPENSSVFQRWSTYDVAEPTETTVTAHPPMGALRIVTRRFYSFDTPNALDDEYSHTWCWTPEKPTYRIRVPLRAPVPVYGGGVLPYRYTFRASPWIDTDYYIPTYGLVVQIHGPTGVQVNVSVSYDIEFRSKK